MERRYISAVKPLERYILQIDFISGSRLFLDMNPYLDKIRFRALADPKIWSSAVTNGIFVRFGSVELSHDELLSMAEREHEKQRAMKKKVKFMGECTYEDINFDHTDSFAPVAHKNG